MDSNEFGGFMKTLALTLLLSLLSGTTAWAADLYIAYSNYATEAPHVFKVAVKNEYMDGADCRIIVGAVDDKDEFIAHLLRGEFSFYEEEQNMYLLEVGLEYKVADELTNTMDSMTIHKNLASSSFMWEHDDHALLIGSKKNMHLMLDLNQYDAESISKATSLLPQTDKITSVTLSEEDGKKIVLKLQCQSVY